MKLIKGKKKPEPALDDYISDDDYAVSYSGKGGSSYSVPRYTGDYVKGDDGKEYYLFGDELREWNAKVADKSLSDREFWDWWHKYRDRKKLIPKWEGSFTGGAKKKGGLSGWWHYDLHSAFGSAATSASKRLALALKAVQTTVRIVDDSVPAFTVAWASDDNSSTDLVRKRMVINPKPITEPGELSNADAIDITTGFGLHEASHARYTKDVHKQLEEPEWLTPKTVAMFLANVIEDVRIEGLTSKEYPGFAGYFVKALAYMWGEMLEQKDMIPTQWGVGENALRDCLNAIVMRIKWPKESAEFLTHQSFVDELPWWDDWNAQYQANKVNLRKTIEAGLERLRMNPEVDEQMTKLAAQEAAGEALDEFLQGLMKACMSATETDDLLDAETGQEVDDMVQENLREWKPRTQHGATRPSIWVKHPLESANSRNAYLGKPSGLVDRLKAVLQFRPELPRFSERLLKSGTLNEDELYRFAMDDYRIFEKQVVETYPNAQVSLLVDMSGSMTSGIGKYGSGDEYRSKVSVAQEIAQLFVLALSGMEGVNPKVFGHTGDLSADQSLDERTVGTAEFYELWEPGEPLTRLGLITSMDHGDNFDGYAIEYCVQELLDRGRRDDQRLLIVLSDGYPAGDDYGDTEAEQHVRGVTDDADRHGVFVLQVAIDSALRPQDQAAMFKNWMQYTSYDELPRQMVKALSGFLNG